MPKDILRLLQSYNDELTISQVVKFFERLDVALSKTMVQNYVKLQLLPPPNDRRYYSKNHLLLLAIIDSLKSFYSLEEIKAILTPLMPQFASFDSAGVVYSSFRDAFDSAARLLAQTPTEPFLLLALSVLAKQSALSDSDLA